MYFRYANICLHLNEYLCKINVPFLCILMSFYSQTGELLTMEHAQRPYQPLTTGTNCCWVQFRFHFQDMFAGDRWCFIRLYSLTGEKTWRDQQSRIHCLLSIFSYFLLLRGSDHSIENTPGKRLTVSKSGGDGNSSIIILQIWVFQLWHKHRPRHTCGECPLSESLSAFYASFDPGRYNYNDVQNVGRSLDPYFL